jgi:3'(2'), 5'-bisphosphate nucleotidase
MKLFLDTNIFLDLILKREHFDKALLIFNAIEARLFSGVILEGAFKNGASLPLQTNQHPEKLLRVVASKSHLSIETQAYIDDLAKTTEVIECVSKGSSLKLCMVAEGSADIYPRLAPTMEWDTAAADAIVREAGKMTYEHQKNTLLTYNKENLLNPWFVVTKGI